MSPAKVSERLVIKQNVIGMKLLQNYWLYLLVADIINSMLFGVPSSARESKAFGKIWIVRDTGLRGG